MTKASDNPFPSILVTEGSAPSTPASGFGRIYAKTTGLFFIGDNGVEVGPLAAATGATNLQSARYVRSAGDYTTTSTTFVDVDGTNMVFTFTTGARRVLLGLVGSAFNSGSNGYCMFDVTVDGTRQGGDFGLVNNRVATSGHHLNVSFTYLTDVLSAASHTFKLQWRTVAGTSTLQGANTNAARCEFYAVELYA